MALTREEFARLLRYRAQHEKDELLILWNRTEELARELKEMRATNYAIVHDTNWRDILSLKQN